LFSEKWKYLCFRGLDKLQTAKCGFMVFHGEKIVLRKHWVAFFYRNVYGIMISILLWEISRPWRNIGLGNPLNIPASLLKDWRKSLKSIINTLQSIEKGKRIPHLKMLVLTYYYDNVFAFMMLDLDRSVVNRFVFLPFCS